LRPRREVMITVRPALSIILLTLLVLACSAPAPGRAPGSFDTGAANPP